MGTNTGQEGSSRAESEVAPSSTSKPVKKGKRSRSITPEGGLMQHPYAQRHPSNDSHVHLRENPTKAEPPDTQWQGFVQHSHEQPTGSGDHHEKGPWVHQSYQDQHLKVEPASEQIQLAPHSRQGSVKGEESARPGEETMSHQLSRGLSSSHSLPVSNTDSGNGKKTGLKIKLKLKPS